MDKIKIKRPSALGLDAYLPTEGQGREEMIQIYDWSLEDALKAEEEWECRYGPDVRGRGPLCRWIGARKLKDIYEMYKAGNNQAILEALHICSFNSLPIPRWCEMAFLSSYRKVKFYRAKSWDDVFGCPHAKGTNLYAKGKERDFRRKVVKRIEEIRRNEPSTPIDGALFERVGLEFGIGGKTLTETYYYKEKKYRLRFLSMQDNHSQ